MKPRRIRVQTPIDWDCVSPESIIAAQTFATALMFERAESLGVALDWNTFRCYARRSRRQGALLLTQWARVL